MIDWWGVVINSIWIVAMAVGLAVVSMAYYRSQIEDEKLKIVLNRVGYSVPLNMAGAVFCGGMALTSDRWWEITLWVVLMILFLVQLYYLFKRLKVE